MLTLDERRELIHNIIYALIEDVWDDAWSAGEFDIDGLTDRTVRSIFAILEL